jgi:uncharacterized tellurite resistance protein B-like protein
VLRRLLGFGSEPDDRDERSTEGIRRIVSALDQVETGRARYLAAFAYILSRAARADHEITEAETRAMERQVMAHAHLPEDQAVLVVQMAKMQSALFAGTEDFHVTRIFNELASHEEKLALLTCLFAVSSADAGIATIEDNEIRRISRELRVEHADFVRIRAAFRRHLTVLGDEDASEGS